MNSPITIAQLGLTDNEIEALALKHIAPKYEKMRAIVPELAPYQESEQFRRVKALLADALPALRAKGVQAGDEREEFEAALKKRGQNVERWPHPHGGYRSSSTEIAWHAWNDRAALASAPVTDERPAVLFDCGKAAGRQEVKDQQQAPDFQTWIRQAYREPESTTYTIHNMEVAYQAGLAAQASTVAGEAQQEIEQMAVNRYRPVPDGMFSYKVVAGDGSRSLYTGTKDNCLRLAAKLTEAFLDGAFVANAAPQASAEALVRYCPGCGSVGPIEGEYRDCCPDGNEARMIPAALAEKCRDTFKIAVRTLLAEVAANDATGWLDADNSRRPSTHANPAPASEAGDA